jgi:hypothetical protein
MQLPVAGQALPPSPRLNILRDYKAIEIMVGSAAEDEFNKMRGKFQVGDFRLY